MSDEIYQLMPPRGLWKRPLKSLRKGVPAIDNVNSLRLTINSLTNAKHRSTHLWATNLDRFVSKIKERALSCSGVKFKYSEIRKKAKKKGGNKRALVILNLEERILDSLFCDYLRTCFDQFFSNAAFAYRSKRANQPAPTHNDAVRALISYSSRKINNEKWVAECDIEGFFDSLSHQTIRKCISEFLIRNKMIIGEDIDPRAMLAIDSYLDFYNFNKDIFLPETLADNVQRCKWPAKKLEHFHSDLSNEDIGIPQGGAISTVLANIVLDNADQAVIQAGTDSDLFYARYSDDIIIVHTDRGACQDALDRYIASLSELKLPVHQPEPVARYSKAFWDHKSKSPYRWANKIDEIGVSPWLSFVGYQIHASHLIRIRPDSIKKEIKKQVNIMRGIKYQIKNTKDKRRAIRVGMKNIILSTKMRLIAMAVGGKRKVWHKRGTILPFCWTYAVDALRNMPHDRSQLRNLDYHREAIIAKLRKWLDKNLPSSSLEPMKRNDKVERQAAKLPKFFGYPFSYVAPLEK